MTFIVKNSKWIRISLLCNYVGEWLQLIETEWALWFFKLFFFNFKQKPGHYKPMATIKKASSKLGFCDEIDQYMAKILLS